MSAKSALRVLASVPGSCLSPHRSTANSLHIPSSLRHTYGCLAPLWYAFTPFLHTPDFFNSGCGTWFGSIKDLTFTSTFCSLSPAEAQIIVDHWEARRHILVQLGMTERETEREGADHPDVLALLATTTCQLEDLRSRLDVAIEKETALSPVGQAFVKLSTRSPKDSRRALARARCVYQERLDAVVACGGDASVNARWRILCEESSRSGAVSDGASALELLLDSDRVFEDLEYALRGPPLQPAGETKETNEIKEGGGESEEQPFMVANNAMANDSTATNSTATNGTAKSNTSDVDDNGGARQWGKSRDGEMYTQVQGPGNPSWGKLNPSANLAAAAAATAGATVTPLPLGSPQPPAQISEQISERISERPKRAWNMDLVARAWDPRLKPESEFRGICWNGTLTCLSQYFHPLHFPELEVKRGVIEADILACAALDTVTEAVGKMGGHCILDFAWLGPGEVIIVELNPFDGVCLGTFPCSTGLFLWEKPEDKAIMMGEAPFEFRLREEPLNAVALKTQCNPSWRDIIYTDASGLHG